MAGEDLQLAISANGVIKSLLADREKDVEKRLQEVSRHLEELIDSLETDFLNRNKDSPLSMHSSSPFHGNVGHTELVTASQQEYMKATIELLRKKDEAMERMNQEHNKILKEIVQAHEETIRHITQGREETTRTLTARLAGNSEEKP